MKYTLDKVEFTPRKLIVETELEEQILCAIIGFTKARKPDFFEYMRNRFNKGAELPVDVANVIHNFISFLSDELSEVDPKLAE